MERNIAESMMKCLLTLSDSINDATALTMNMESISEQKEFRKELVKIINATYDSMAPIIRQYPDLDPDNN